MRTPTFTVTVEDGLAQLPTATDRRVVRSYMAFMPGASGPICTSVQRVYKFVTAFIYLSRYF